MKSDRINESYGGYELLSAFYKGKYLGRAWLNKKLMQEIEGSSVEDVLSKLKETINQLHRKRIVPGAATPAVEAFVEAFQRIMRKMNDGQYAMLKAHYRAPGRRLTPLELAEAAGYDGIGGVGLWYGFLGQWLFEQMSVELDLSLYDDGSPVYTSVLARYITDPSNPDGHKVWEMRPEVAEAIEVLGFDR